MDTPTGQELPFESVRLTLRAAATSAPSCSLVSAAEQVFDLVADYLWRALNTGPCAPVLRYLDLEREYLDVVAERGEVNLTFTDEQGNADSDYRIAAHWTRLALGLPLRGSLDTRMRREGYAVEGASLEDRHALWSPSRLKVVRLPAGGVLGRLYAMTPRTGERGSQPPFRFHTNLGRKGWVQLTPADQAHALAVWNEPLCACPLCVKLRKTHARP